jgi:hypothetical protein
VSWKAAAWPGELGAERRYERAKKLDEGDVREHTGQVPGAGCSGVPACLGLDEGAGRNPGLPPLAAGGEAQAANKFSLHLCSVVKAALQKTAEPFAARTKHGTDMAMCEFVWQNQKYTVCVIHR